MRHALTCLYEERRRLQEVRTALVAAGAVPSVEDDYAIRSMTRQTETEIQDVDRAIKLIEPHL